MFAESFDPLDDEASSCTGGLYSVTERPAFTFCLIFTALAVLSLFVTSGILFGNVTVTEGDLAANIANQVTVYESGGAASLPISSFSVNVSWSGSNGVLFSVLPAYVINIGNSGVSYSQVAVQASMLLRNFAYPAPPLFLSNDSSVSFTLSTNYANGTSSILHVPPVPLYRTKVLRSGVRTGLCRTDGGYLNSGESTCTLLEILTAVCVPLNLSEATGAALPSWQLSSSMSGCLYPFTSAGQYSLVPVDPPASWTGQLALNMSLMSIDDPLLYAEQQTDGFAEFTRLAGEKRVGIVIVIVACVLGATLLAVFIVRRICKRIAQREEIRSNSLKQSLLADTRTFADQPLAGPAAPAVRLQPKSSRLWIQLAGAVVLSAGSLGAGLPLLGNFAEQLVYSWPAYAGVLLILIVTPLGFISLLMFWSSLARRVLWPAAVRALWFVFWALACWAGAILAVVFLIQPTTPIGTLPGNADLMAMFFGVLLAMVLIPLGGLPAVLCVRVWQGRNRTPPSGSGHDTNPLDAKVPIVGLLPAISPPPMRRGVLGALVAFVFFFVLFVAVALLPPLWNVSIPPYLTFVSPYTMGSWVVGDFGFTIKIFPDVVAYYLFISVMLAVGVLSACWPAFRAVLNRRIRIGSTSALNVLFRLGTTPGELVLMLLYLGLNGYWFAYWYAGNGRLAVLSSNERFARVFGHMVTLPMSLLVLPVARNSIWERVYGVPYESVLRYHRLLGVWFFVATTTHMLAWYVLWFSEGSWTLNVYTIYYKQYASDFTIPLVELAWICMVAMVVTALPQFRRRHWELFKYTHHLFLFVFLAALVHAWSLWYFFVGSALLWFVDRLSRFLRGTRHVEVVSMSHGCGHMTNLVLRCDGMSYYPGQYAFINIPAISASEWHPFTISSSPLTGLVTFNIKNMGMPHRLPSVSLVRTRDASADMEALHNAPPRVRDRLQGQFTSRLARMAAVAPRAIQSGEQLTVNLEGPYGSWGDFAENSVLLLIAGGVGVTPLHAIFQDLLLRARRQHEADEGVADKVDVNAYRGKTHSQYSDRTGQSGVSGVSGYTRASGSTMASSLSTPVNLMTAGAAASAAAARAARGSGLKADVFEVLEENLRLRSEPLPGTHVRHVHLLWTAERDVTLMAFAETLLAALELDPLGACFTFTLHMTERHDITSEFTADWQSERTRHPADAPFPYVSREAVDMVHAKALHGRPQLQQSVVGLLQQFVGEKIGMMV